MIPFLIIFMLFGTCFMIVTGNYKDSFGGLMISLSFTLTLVISVGLVARYLDKRRGDD